MRGHAPATVRSAAQFGRSRRAPGAVAVDGQCLGAHADSRLRGTIERSGSRSGRHRQCCLRRPDCGPVQGLRSISAADQGVSRRLDNPQSSGWRSGDRQSTIATSGRHRPTGRTMPRGGRGGHRNCRRTGRRHGPSWREVRPGSGICRSSGTPRCGTCGTLSRPQASTNDPGAGRSSTVGKATEQLVKTRSGMSESIRGSRRNAWAARYRTDSLTSREAR